VAEDHKFSDRTKHIATRHFFVREQVGWGTVRVEWVPTKQQAADIFTKPLAPTPFIEAAKRLNLSERAA
ncbi:MAG TPA: Ty1/Copia family ribonuclease HI, partial [Nitrospiria bacterium]|nr:Ty1/Copia family ribonuclease HI [Nitrospiria bacterium]